MPKRAGPQPGEKCRVRRNASSAILNLPSLNRHCARPSLTSGGALGCALSACTPHSYHVCCTSMAPAELCYTSCAMCLTKLATLSTFA